MHNIVLIGMPGSGKTSVGNVLAKKLAKNLIDTDEMIEARAKMSVAEIFEKFGETVFRRYETECAIFSSQHTNSVISTGGGIILKDENMQALSYNAKVVFLDRTPEQIMLTSNLKNRPLVQNDIVKLQRLYEERHELYIKYADFIVSDFSSVKDAVMQIKEYIKMR